tara:strand:- start:205 stop:756 length:552 start_codon:yes stop_codon:yes gene_type:complete
MESINVEPARPHAGRAMDGSEKPITDAIQAEEAIEFVLYWKKEKDKVNAHVQKLKDRADAYDMRENARIDRKIQYHTDRLRSFTVDEIKHKKEKTVNLATGKLSLTKRQPDVSIFQEIEYRKWISIQVANHGMRDDDFYKTKEPVESKVSQEKLNKYFKKTGEIPKGVQVEHHEDNFKVEGLD